MDPIKFDVSCSHNYEACHEIKDTSRLGRWGNYLCLLWQYCCRPCSFTCDPCLFDSGRTGFLWVRLVWNGSANTKSRQMWGAFRHTISQPKVIVQRKFTNKLLLFMVMLWIGKMWRSCAVNSPKEGLMFKTNKEAVGHIWSLTTFFRKFKEKFAQIYAWR
jgi:hypothetical protein